MLIAKNIETGNYLESLGMKGEYPWSSSVGFKLVIDDKTTKYWFDTEINPRSKTASERFIEESLDKINPTLGVMRFWLSNDIRVWKVNYVGEGCILGNKDKLSFQNFWTIVTHNEGVIKFHCDKKVLPQELIDEIESFELPKINNDEDYNLDELDFELEEE